MMKTDSETATGTAKSLKSCLIKIVISLSPIFIFFAIISFLIYRIDFGDPVIEQMCSGIDAGISQGELIVAKGKPFFSCSFSTDCVEQTKALLGGSRNAPLLFDDVLIYSDSFQKRQVSCAFFFDDEDSLLDIRCGYISRDSD